MQSGRSVPKVVQRIRGFVRAYYYRPSDRDTKTMRKRAHRRRVNQDLKNYDEETFDDSPQDEGETMTEWVIW